MKWTPRIRINFALSLVLFGLVMSYYVPFLARIEARPGIVLNDWILNHLPTLDLSWIIFTMINGVLLATITHLFWHPTRLVLWLQTYTTMMIFRVFAMSLVALDPPSGMIVLRDPFIELFSQSSHPLTRDLFFSGHTATMVICYLVIVNQTAKKIILSLTILIVIGLLLQHVHYSIDIAAAPFFAYGSFILMKKLNEKLMSAS